MGYRCGLQVRDRSVITGGGGGGATEREGGGQVKFNPYRKRGGKRFRHAEGGGGTKRSGVVLTWFLEVLACNQVPPSLKRGGLKSCTLS